MVRRCTNPLSPNFKYFGAKGIVVCSQWLDKETGFDQFVKDLGPRPSPKHLVRRQDKTKSYCPENCYWSDDLHLADHIAFAGELATPGEWSKRLGIPETTIRSRLQQMNSETALTKPVRGDRSVTHFLIRYQGERDGKTISTDSPLFKNLNEALDRWNRIKNKNEWKYVNSTLILLRVSNGTETQVLVHRGTPANPSENA